VEVISLTEDQSMKEWEDYEEIKQQFIQVIAKNMNLYGLTPSIGRLYGVLFFSDDPMTLDDMREELAMSKTSMSTGVRTLLNLKMVEPVFKKGVRKDLYRSEEDWYKSFTALFSKTWKNNTQTNIEEMQEAKDKLLSVLNETDDEGLIEQINHDLERLNYGKEYYEWLLRFINVIESGKIFDYIPKVENKSE
jgi:HTH-type transcriptional regulator, glycine betaine synthesis regulator